MNYEDAVDMINSVIRDIAVWDLKRKAVCPIFCTNFAPEVNTSSVIIASRVSRSPTFNLILINS